MLGRINARPTKLIADCTVSTIVHRAPRACYAAQWLAARGFATARKQYEAVPLRKHLKDELKRKKVEQKSKGPQQLHDDKWELTVGIEIHAQLNTESKLFSDTSAEGGGAANQHVALFDAAMPGAQPRFQVATLLPAVRAALALDCTIQAQSGWDRKHYFHWDQPNGYQITQYYQPFAKDGTLSVTADDGVPIADLQGQDELKIGIKQIQMEQDTAKTTLHPPSTYHIDLNRAGHALIEIITLPQIHSPQTAAAVVRKIQALLKSVNACVSGMELGGLRADVNVSVKQKGTTGSQAYSGVAGLGQRTEIKNLSSFKAVEDAIIAERDRQISVLEAGGNIEGETRGWTLGSKETTRLRGKEGEVDYRYIPEADLPPLLVGDDLVDHIRQTMPELPDQTLQRLQDSYGVTLKDAKTLYSLDDGERLEFMEDVVHRLRQHNTAESAASDNATSRDGKLVSNWVLHEIGGILTTRELTWADIDLKAYELADLLRLLIQKSISARGAKQLLAALVERTGQDRSTVINLQDELNLHLRPLDDHGYTALAEQIMEQHPDHVAAIMKGKRGKIKFLVGQMLRQAEEGTIEPEKAQHVLEQMLATKNEE